ncbi:MULTISPECIES: bifunctional 4-hydroxy-2-oxoglutarate aldolase/2-dehydro-3-deoxy-phosphogluconate aldolase [unclassified Haloferax]|jgi:2-dehydro-3-deoxyphosphogluconate aldolase/(4S)-4-hydroxy-2-oxoglutarate aldolase|uniref:Bifunctional 4-hydroxy-2-oxoglutarate aldolase/2-dehydro-3-deoxy-phosphogluconate aldolase n=1 Tax=Haloferax sp. Atlit-48N TaxID=2077198 RepID=A0ACD5I476_9EURY|nr:MULTISPECIES: bifunctional 4-hydroxy-2-oxoglutarate aldolase/2-dehydro-3-deoxy-phosphogluconate aldolase [unclassified Haloferax]RDZ30327.1 2-dehydro-3-deoxyphosphogluconate aldolase [Haloferax sp. Atlit-48N]RDZ34055.1 2-dehydro-3-deoxyphosphogluconate aldolase [Haloferax sp. Atlit-24N]RLM33660.1 bifunctional 4-hydroxy-2-oxoglutarate aldolase/2-dehydro-3-deoxy-phosphogluconate aldolase [Haloferax sp. Atlit-109R]RLM40759.1 bifunctional 4-hydroxy-2-oxoglutarate aldolase/2-dehydro-3-deoxy-phosp
MVASTAQRIAESGIVAIIRGTDPETAIETVDALRRGGVSTVEITANTESVLNMIRDVSESFAADEVTIGAGTVLDAETARATTLAGAEFIVTPSFDEGVVETANRYGVPSLVGIATPTEAVNAFEAGADMVKVFPADTLGPRFISALGGPLGHIPTVPTGGVGLDNVDEFFDAGATAVGVGSSIVDTEAIACGEFDVIEANARVFREAVEAARSE